MSRSYLGGGPVDPPLLHLCVVPPGMDTQLVVRPLLDKVEKNTRESALRKIAFPHVSPGGLLGECPLPAAVASPPSAP